jgi:hypothetical protein
MPVYRRVFGYSLMLAGLSITICIAICIAIGGKDGAVLADVGVSAFALFVCGCVILSQHKKYRLQKWRIRVQDDDEAK